MSTEHPGITRFREEHARRRGTGEVVVLPESAHTAALAAEALGCEVGAIANSLVFTVQQAPGGPAEPLLVLTTGAHRVDTAAVAAGLWAARVRRADADLVRQATGFAIGGVAPVGHPAPLRTLVDTALAQYSEVWAAGGIPHAVFPTTFAELVRVTGGRPSEVA